MKELYSQDSSIPKLKPFYTRWLPFLGPCTSLFVRLPGSTSKAGVWTAVGYFSRLSDLQRLALGEVLSNEYAVVNTLLFDSRFYSVTLAVNGHVTGSGEVDAKDLFDVAEWVDTGRNG